MAGEKKKQRQENQSLRNEKKKNKTKQKKKHNNNNNKKLRRNLKVKKPSMEVMMKRLQVQKTRTCRWTKRSLYNL